MIDSGAQEPPGGTVRRWWVATVLAVVAAAATVAVGLTLFPLFSGNNDEPVYVFQALMLSDGHLTASAELHDEAFRPWLTGVHDGRRFTQYQPGFPAVLAAAEKLTGSMRPALAAIAAATILATTSFAYELTRRRCVSVLAAAVLTCSPLFLLHWSLYLSYAASTAAVTTLGWLLLRGARRASTWTFVAAGAAFGISLLVRPLDAVIFAAPVAALAAWRLRQAGVLLWRPLLGCVVGAVPFLLTTLAYNAAVTGGALRFPITATDPRNTFGFGTRGILRSEPPYDYPFGDAVAALGSHLSGTPGWLGGGAVALVLAAVGVRELWRRDRPTAAAACGLVIVFPLAYFFWWATSLSAPSVVNGMGPQYYVPAFVPLAVLVATGAAAVARGDRRIVAGVALLGVLATAHALPDKVNLARYVLASSRENHRALDELDGEPTLVMLPNSARYILSPYPYFINDPGLDGDTLFARDLGPAADDELAARFPDRKLVRLHSEQTLQDDYFESTVGLVPVASLKGSTVELPLRITSPWEGQTLSTYLEVQGVRHEIPLESRVVGSRPLDVTWTLAAPTGADRSTDPFTAVVPHSDEPLDVRVGIRSVDPTGERPDELVEVRHTAEVVDVAGAPQVLVRVPGDGWQYVHFPGLSLWMARDVSEMLTVG